jgi:beta-fructofuranosidase
MLAWDLWLVRQGEDYHLFHLQAPPGLHPELRHGRASVGHAVSRDLRTWRDLGTAFTPGSAGSFDDRSIWTGSILARDDDFALLYTGLQRSAGLVQRIGLATSADLGTWTRRGSQPVLTADPARYQTDVGGPLRVEDWRDPYLCRVDGAVHAFITARLPPPPCTSPLALSLAHAAEFAAIAAPAPVRSALLQDGPLAGRGCVALATCADEALEAWTIHDPVLAPGAYGMLECPQYLEHQGLSYLFFSTWAGSYTRAWARRIGGAQTGLHAFVAESPRGEYRPVNGTGVVLGTASGCYATRLVVGPEGEWRALSWRRHKPGRYRIGLPWRVTLRGDRVDVRKE